MAPLTPEDREAEPLEAVERARFTRLHSTTDAMEWAREFMRVVDAGVTVDFGLMVGWFANAIETAKSSSSAECRRLEALVERQGEERRRLREWIEDAVLALGAVLIIAERWGISGDGINSANHQRLIGEAAELLGVSAAPETEAGADGERPSVHCTCRPGDGSDECPYIDQCYAEWADARGLKIAAAPDPSKGASE